MWHGKRRPIPCLTGRFGLIRLAVGMDALAKELSAKLERWQPRTSAEVRALVAEIIARADENALDLGRSRTAEREVLDLLDADAPASRHSPTGRDQR